MTDTDRISAGQTCPRLSPDFQDQGTVPGPVPACPRIKRNTRSDLSPDLSPSVPAARLSPCPQHGVGDRGQAVPDASRITAVDSTVLVAEWSSPMTDMDRFINIWNAEYNEAMARHFRARLEDDAHRAAISAARARAIHDVLLDMERHGLHDGLVWQS